jgi:predicted MFS family arabinose efflux permease
MEVAALESALASRLANDRRAWGTVMSMTLCVTALIASEFMPVSLLSPIAVDLAITEGQTGQAISISGTFAVLTSLLVASLTRRIDRRILVTGFTALLVVSGMAVCEFTS